MQWMQLSCQDTSPVISEMMDHRVSSGKYWRTKIHLLMCGACRYYKTQLETLGRLACELGREDSSAQTDVVLSPESKTKMKNFLKSRH